MLRLICKDCGSVFYLDSGEIDFYKSRNLNLPRRCASCRRKAKDERFVGLRDVMRDSPPSKSSASGRDVSRTGGNAKHISTVYLDGLEEDLDFSPEENYIARRFFGSWDDYLTDPELKKP